MKAYDHIRKERQVYNDACAASKEWVHKRFANEEGKINAPSLFSDLRAELDECLHIPFNFAQNTCYLANPF